MVAGENLPDARRLAKETTLRLMCRNGISGAVTIYMEVADTYQYTLEYCVPVGNYTCLVRANA